MYRVEANGAVPLGELGKGPHRDPPVWARSVGSLMEYVVGMMRRYYAAAEPNDVWRPTLIAVCRNGDVAPLVQGDAFDSQDWAGMMKVVFRDAQVIRYVQTIEAWASLGPEIPMPSSLSDPSLDALLKASSLPEHDPNRREVAFAFACERKGGSEAQALELVRGESGRVADIRDITASMGVPGGRTAGAFGPLTRLF